MWDKIEKLLKAKGLNQAKLARLIGEHEPRISKWRGGQGEPDRNQLLRIAKALETDMEYLADDSLDEPRPAQGLSSDEIAVLATYRSFRSTLSEDAAIRALATAALTPGRERSGYELPAGPRFADEGGIQVNEVRVSPDKPKRKKRDTA
jgi:transcriptional regulator with XRE-family HTH domain